MTNKLCSFELCGRPVLAKALCQRHYWQQRRGEELMPIRQYGKRAGRTCAIEGCSRPMASSLDERCKMHHARLASGKPDHLAPHTKYVPGDSKTIKTGYVLEYVGMNQGSTGYSWELQHRLVVERELGRKLVAGENVHHRNGVRDDNRPENLELWYVPQMPGQRVDDLIEYVKTYHADRL